MGCPIDQLKTETRNAIDEKHSIEKEINHNNLTANISDAIKKADDINDPALQKIITDSIAQHAANLASDSLKIENEKAMKTTTRDEQQKKKKEKLYRDFQIHDETATLDQLIDYGANYTTRLYKNATLGTAPGRIFAETCQTGSIFLVTKTESARLSKKALEDHLGEGEILPKAGQFEGITQDNDLSNLSLKRNERMEKLLGYAKIPNEVIGHGIEKTTGGMKQAVYDDLFFRYLKDKVITLENKNKEIGKQTRLDALVFERTGASSFIFKPDDQLTRENRVLKHNIIAECKRKASAEAKRMFMDYGENPLIIHKLGSYLPWVNFMYSGTRLLAEHPNLALFASAINSFQNSLSEEAYAVDPEGQKIDLGRKWRMAGLAGFGLGGVTLNMNRLLSFSPMDVGGITPTALLSFVSGSDNIYYKKFYETGTVRSLRDAVLSTFSPVLGKLFEGIDSLKDEKDHGEGYKNITQSLAWMITGMPIKDKTQSIIWEKWIQGDYKGILEMSDGQIKAWLKHRTNEGNGMTIEGIKAAAKAKELGLYGKDDYEEDVDKKFFRVISGMGVHESMTTKDNLHAAENAIAHMGEIISGENFSHFSGDGGKGFVEFLDKIEKFSKTKDFKNFEQVNKRTYETYKHFAAFKEEYLFQSDAIQKMQSDEPNTRMKGNAMLVALKYRFTGDDKMDLQEKTAAILSGKLNKAIIASKEDHSPGILRTKFYQENLLQKGPLVVNYMDQANAVVSLKHLAGLFSGMSRTSGISKTKAAEFRKISDDLYAKQKVAIDVFRKTTHDHAYDQYLLTDGYKSFKDHEENAKKYEQHSLHKEVGIISAMLRKLNFTPEQQKIYEANHGSTTWAKHDLVRPLLAEVHSPESMKIIQQHSNVSEILNQLNQR